ncbi:IPT/TIG domain-containing protein [Actinoplanes sp. NPDC051346]|uniref:IPT/TIG domain-containing protein n=1 Tax=Actinoplanes sp. NPDC051346 TaxID=3155048 RepID=UPI003421D6C1
MRSKARALYRGWLVVAAAVLAAAPATITVTPASAASRGGPVSHAVGGLLVSPTRIPAQVLGGAQAFEALPASVDLRKYAPAPGSQGQVGSCVAWSIGYSIMGYYANRTGGSGAPFAPLFLYLRNVAKGGAPTTGLRPEVVLANLQTAGIDTQANYRQGTTNWKIAPTAAQIENAKKYRVSGYRTLFSGTGQGVAAQTSIKEALAAGSPVTLGIPVRRDFDYLGRHSLYTPNTESVVGHHMITAYGYDAKGVIIRNSWGRDWGNGGDAKLAWSFITNQASSAHVVTGITTPATPGPATPTVTSLSVARGPAGTPVTISGAGLDAATSVRFGAFTATFEKRVTAGVTTLVAVAPRLPTWAKAETGGVVDVAVASAAGASVAGTATRFTYVPPPPAVTALSPTSSAVLGGTTITLSGSDLTGVTAVKVGTTSVAARSVTSWSLTFVAPAKAAGVYEVTVTNPYGTSTRTGQLRYGTAPVITSLSTRFGSTTRAVPVTITGMGFTNASSVQVGDSRAFFFRLSDTELRAMILPGPEGPATLTVTTPGGTSVGSPFYFANPPGATS